MSVVLTECLEEADSIVEQDETLVCIADDEGVLMRILEENAKVLLAQRAETARLADEKASPEYAARDQAARQAAGDAARVAAERAAEQPAPAPAIQAPPVVQALGVAYFPNCAAARAAGAAPIYVGQSGYRAGLDRDKDGVACE